MIKKILANTQQYITDNSKDERKEKGQFFTSVETARYMANGVKAKETISLLDMGAGTGILSAAVVEKLLRSKKTRNIIITMYENDLNIIPVLNRNIDIMREKCAKKNVQLDVNVIQENFITYNEEYWKQKLNGYYDVVISNPPYKKINKNSDESKAMIDIVYGQPNIYGLFMAMGLNLLREKGTYITIVPRSWTSGLYFKAFRKYFLKNLNIKKMHLFVSRDKVFKEESVLQETMIIFGEKSQRQSGKITIATSEENGNFANTEKSVISKSTVITDNDDLYVLLPTSEEEQKILDFMAKLPETLESLGYAFKTGPVVEFRNEEHISRIDFDGAVPLIRPLHMNKGTIQFPIETAKNQYIRYRDKDALFIENANTILLKRFTTKEENRRLQPAIVVAEDFPYENYAIENHVNYLVKEKDTISEDELFGLMGVLASELWDKYYRILNGNTQVNAGEVNGIPMPSMVSLIEIGRRVRVEGVVNSDEIVKEVICGQSNDNASYTGATASSSKTAK